MKLSSCAVISCHVCFVLIFQVLVWFLFFLPEDEITNFPSVLCVNFYALYSCHSVFCVIKSNERKKRDVAGCYSIIGTQEYLYSLFIGIYGTLHLMFSPSFVNKRSLSLPFVFILYFKKLPFIMALAWWHITVRNEGTYVHSSYFCFFPYYREILQILKIKFSFYFTKSQIS